MNNIAINTLSLVLMLPLVSLPVGAGEGFYVAGSVGNASLDDDFDGLTIDDDAISYRITAGWQANTYLALEAGYLNFGDFEQKFVLDGEPGSAKLSADGYTLGLRASYPLASRLEVSGVVGAFFWDGEADVNNVSQASPEDSNLFLGFGVAYVITKSFEITIDWTGYELESTSSDVLSAGLRYRFGR